MSRATVTEIEFPKEQSQEKGKTQLLLSPESLKNIGLTGKIII